MIEGMKDITAFSLWSRVDREKKEPLSVICKRVDIPYARIKRNRTDCRLPSCVDLFLLSKALDVSMEYLLTGEKSTAYPARIDTIARACMDADDLSLELVERVLRIEKKAGVAIS